MSYYKDKSVIVTGGAKGIGNGVCKGFAKEGARVLCADVDEKAGEVIAAQSGELDGTIHFQRADVAENGECKALVDWAVSEWGGVDVLCNNVGIQPVRSYMPAHEYPEELWDRILGVNLKSAFLMSKYCIPEMKKAGGGVIINTASVQGLQSMKGVSAYAASKGGILSLTRQLALECAEDKIRVLAVNPGSIESSRRDEAIEHMGGDREKIIEGIAADHPIGRIGQPEDIANAMLFLASDKASFMTGEYICVDGGMMALGAWA